MAGFTRSRPANAGDLRAELLFPERRNAILASFQDHELTQAVRIPEVDGAQNTYQSSSDAIWRIDYPS